MTSTLYRPSAGALVLLLAQLMLAALASATVPSEWQDIPTFDFATMSADTRGELIGSWGFVWNQLIEPQSIALLPRPVRTVQLPKYLKNSLTDDEKQGRFTHGTATYYARLANLKDVYYRPAINMRYAAEAWQAFWVYPDGSVEELGKSGTISTEQNDQVIRENYYILDLPRKSEDGLLVIHLSMQTMARGGLYGSVIVSEQEQLLRQSMYDLASRAVFSGIGLFVVVQNILIYLRHRSDKSFLLLSIFALSGTVRAAFASNYVNYFIQQDWFTIPSLKIEYILIVWPAVTALHYISHLFPWRHNARLLTGAYSMLAATVVFTVFAPMSEVSYYLYAYNLVLIVITFAAFMVVVHGIVSEHPLAGFFGWSTIPLIVAVFNDILAATTAHYNFYLAEYALIIFLFIHTQRQSVKFVTALKTAEHLTLHLQKEVDLKTRELSKRNLELESKHNRVKLLSQTDHLTGLYNRQSLESRATAFFEQAAQTDGNICIVMMDIDHFKHVNDHFGHQVGDECLVHTASYLRALNLRNKDLIARYGGEEFTIVLPDTSIQSAEHLIQSICDGLSSSKVTGDNYDIRLTASFGIAERKDSSAETYKDLIRFADAALYTAKQNGRNRVECYVAEKAE